MKLKNTKELVLRARSHVREDHVKQGTYGDVKSNGKTTFVGCAIGCLSTPHRKEEMLKFLEQVKGSIKINGDYDFTISDQDQRDRLAKEFGICRDLAIAAEGFFEGQETHGAAIEFVKDFAESLVEGSQIVPSQVREWVDVHLGINEAMIEDYEYDCGYDYDEESDSWYDLVSTEIKDSSPKRAAQKTAAFLEWLNSRPVAS